MLTPFNKHQKQSCDTSCLIKKGDDIHVTVGNEEQCGNLYQVAELATKYINKQSYMRLSVETVYALFCNAMYDSLLPYDHASSSLEEVKQSTYVNYFHVMQYSRAGYRVEGRVNEVTQIKHNHYIDKHASLEGYVQGIAKLSASNFIDRICDDFFKVYCLPRDEKYHEKFHDHAALRLLYGALVDIVEYHNEDPDINGNRAMFFVIENKHLHDALKSRDYRKYVVAMDRAATKDPFTFKHVFLHAMVWSISHTRRLYNTSISCAIAYKQSKNEILQTQGGYLLGVATACLNPLLLQNPELQRKVSQLLKREQQTYPLSRDAVQTLLTNAECDFLDLLSRVNVPKIADSLPEIDANYALERIAAVSLIMYPGAKISGDEIILLHGRVQVMNIGNKKLDGYNQYYDSNYNEDSGLNSDCRIAQDIQTLFASVQEMSSHLNWEVFIKELQATCTKMRSLEFAKSAQKAIGKRLDNSLHESIKFNTILLPVVVYESVLPRVKEIEKFLENEHLVTATKHLTKLVHDPEKEILSMHDFLSLSGYKNSYDAHAKHNWLQGNLPLFDAIDRNHNRFLMNFPSKPYSIEETLPKTPVVTKTLHTYRTTRLNPKQRKGIVKTLAQRPLQMVLKHELFYPTATVAILVTILTAYLVSTILEPIFTIAAGIVYTTILVALVGAYSSRLKCKDYIMSIPKNFKESNFMCLSPKLHKEPSQMRIAQQSTDDTSLAPVEKTLVNQECNTNVVSVVDKPSSISQDAVVLDIASCKSSEK